MSGMTTSLLPHGPHGLLDEPILEVYAHPQGQRCYLPMPVVCDENADCCTITSSLYIRYRLDLTSHRVEDSHSCRHASCCARVELTLNRDCITYMLAFCVLKGSEMLAVMTGREDCWSQPPPRTKDMAALVMLRSEGEPPL
ncbi:hypothetical protein CLAIMM_00565 isoform 2 [Cladophialophora immunda]|nr:hypothetical protein CLAIMM_00565 isoform 2 [Cladophialophora immunda]